MSEAEDKLEEIIEKIIEGMDNPDTNKQDLEEKIEDFYSNYLE